MPGPIFFSSQTHFRKWLEKNHDKKAELFVGFYKVGSGKPSMSWSESVDQALCFGWIDGVRKSLGSESYSIRFTPRRAGSVWSAINIIKVEELIKRGLMQAAGLAAFENRNAKRSAIYSYENEAARLTAEFEAQFRKNRKAWRFFEEQPPWYKRKAIYRVMSAKQEKTRISRLEKLILASETGERD